MQVLPSRRSLIRMLGAVLSEMDEDQASRKWFTEESIAQAMSPMKVNVPAPAHEGTPKSMPSVSSMCWSPTIRLERDPFRR